MKKKNFLKNIRNYLKNNKKMDFFHKAELVISHPHKFFHKIVKEKDIWAVFKFYFVFVFLSIVINLLFNLQNIVKDQLYLTFGRFCMFILLTVLFIGILSVLIALSSFVLYWLYHILIKIFRGKRRYNATYKLLYAATPLLIVTLIPNYGLFKIILKPLFIIAAIDTFYIEFVGLRIMHKMSKENAFAVVLISAVIGILSIAYLLRMGWLVI
jgi:hypothetical protein